MVCIWCIYGAYLVHMVHIWCIWWLRPGPFVSALLVQNYCVKLWSNSKVQNGVHHSVHVVPGLGARWCLTPELLVSSPNQRLHTCAMCAICAWEVAQCIVVEVWIIYLVL